jgi:hypothetical protein
MGINYVHIRAITEEKRNRIFPNVRMLYSIVKHSESVLVAAIYIEVSVEEHFTGGEVMSLDGIDKRSKGRIIVVVVLSEYRLSISNLNSRPLNPVMWIRVWT